jgi:hypothetical protein
LVTIMDDAAIDRYITSQIRKRGITPYDIIGDDYIDPTPQVYETPAGQRARWNRFSCSSWDLRLCELLTENGFDPDKPYANLSVPLKDLVRFWWNNCVDPELFVGEIFEDILLLYKDRMMPERKEKQPDLSNGLDGLLEAVQPQRRFP